MTPPASGLIEETALRDTQLLLGLSQRLAGTLSLKDIYTIFTQGVRAVGAERCVVHLCDDLGPDNLPRISQVVAVDDIDPQHKNSGANELYLLADYAVLDDLIRTREPWLIEDIASDDRLSAPDQEFLGQFGVTSLIINPLISHSHVIGLVFMAYRHHHPYNQREQDLYHSICQQVVMGLDRARQFERLETALAETQTLYRAGRVLAGASDLQEILEEALVEFVYSLGLDQGGVTMLTPDRLQGQLMAYVQDGQLQNVEKLKFPIDETIPYQGLLLAGRPYVSIDVANDPRFKNFRSFNKSGLPKSLLQAPMIIRGETIGWIGADAIREHRQFSQQEVDLARAMADQIAVTIQNRRLLEKTELRASRLKAAASVGESVSRMQSLTEIFNTTVDLIRDSFKFYHVSIFLVDEAREWAVVHASTGEVGRIMVERPHRLQVGGNSIVGFVTSKGQPRIALDVGEDAVHFKNPLLPNTRSEMSLPMISRGQVIGALDVQSTEPNAFSDEDIDTLQIMSDQLANAIENVRLLQNVQDGQKFMKSIIDQIPDPIFIKDREHRWVVVNQHFAQDIMARPEVEIIGRSDYDFLPKEEADWFWLQNDKVFTTGQVQETEETIVTPQGQTRFMYTRKVPMFGRDGQVEYLIGLINDITERKQNEATVQAALTRTQSLYRISDTLATSADPQTIAALVLSEYLRLLNLNDGIFLLLDKTASTSELLAWFKGGQPVKDLSTRPIDEDPLIQYLFNHPQPLVIEDITQHPLTQNNPDFFNGLTTLLLIPLILRGRVSGLIGVGSAEITHTFSQTDLELGETIADQLLIWLENRQLLAEAQYRFSRLQTAAEVSRSASSILEANELINNSVNLIRNQFGFYYVGLFLVDDAGEWAVLRAGTGEAGRIQIERNHRLKIGGGSMIGWCMANRQARIALDVGQEAVRFQNPFLPDTHSEMALPLISRDEVIGALTVQSTEQGAFSPEDITLLQTMADQLANAIQNARLFAQTQNALAEAEALYQITQELLSARDEETVYQLAMKAISLSHSDTATIYMYLDQTGSTPDEQMLEQKVTWVSRGSQDYIPKRLKVSNIPLEALIPQHNVLVIEDTTANDPRLSESIRRELILQDIRSLLAVPLSTYQRRLGFLLFTNTTKGKTFSSQQTRFYTTIAQQMVVALENIRLLTASERRARREEIIREITSKIRSGTTTDDILKTTVTELSKALGAARGGITLGFNPQLWQPNNVAAESKPTSPNSAPKKRPEGK